MADLSVDKEPIDVSPPSHIKLWIDAREINIIDDVRARAKQTPEIVAQIAAAITEKLQLKKPEFPDSKVNEFAEGMIDDSVDTINRLLVIAKKADMDVDMVLATISSNVNKIIYSDAGIVKFITEKKQRLDELRKRSKESIQSLGGEVGTLSRSMLRSYIGTLDVIGKAVLVKKAYSSINKRGWVSMYNLIKPMGGIVYNSGDDTDAFKHSIVLARTKTAVKVLDDLTDEEFEKLRINDQFFINRYTKEIQSVKRTIKKNDLNRTMKDFKTVYDQLPPAVKQICPYDRLTTEIEQILKNPDRELNSITFAEQTGLKQGSEKFRSDILRLGSDEYEAAYNMRGMLYNDDTMTIIKTDIPMELRTIEEIHARILEMYPDLSKETELMVIKERIIGAIKQILKPYAVPDMPQVQVAEQNVSRSPASRRGAKTTSGVSGRVKFVPKQKMNPEKDKVALQTLLQEYAESYLLPMRATILSRFDGINQKLRDMIFLIFDQIHAIRMVDLSSGNSDKNSDDVAKSKLTAKLPAMLPDSGVTAAKVDTGSIEAMLKKRIKGDEGMKIEGIDFTGSDPLAVETSVKKRKDVMKKESSNLFALDKFIKLAAKGKVRFIIVPLTLVNLDNTDDELHANVVMIDLRNKTIEHYEPHGTSQYVTNRTEMIEQILSIFGKPDGKYSGRLTSLKDGFTVSTLSTKLSYSNKGAQMISNYPYCLSWCMYISLLRVLYPNKNFVEIETMSKSATHYIDDDVFKGAEQSETMESKYTLLDGCDLRERIENFTIFLSRMGLKMDMIDNNDSFRIMGKTADTSDLSDDMILDTINSTISNSELSVSDRPGVVSVIERTTSDEGLTGGGDEGPGPGRSNERANNKVSMYKIKKYRF